nr:hypothetical protein CFP56_05198 [Quercus suber]
MKIKRKQKNRNLATLFLSLIIPIPDRNPRTDFVCACPSFNVVSIFATTSSITRASPELTTNTIFETPKKLSESDSEARTGSGGAEAEEESGLKIRCQEPGLSSSSDL